MKSNEKHIFDPGQIHRRQTLGRIYLPLGLISLLALGTGIFLTLKSGTNGSISQTWSSIGLILLIIPPAILCVVIITVLILAIFGMAKVNKSLPPHMSSIRQKIVLVNQNAQMITNKTTIPIIKTRSVFSAIDAFIKIILRKQK